MRSAAQAVVLPLLCLSAAAAPSPVAVTIVGGDQTPYTWGGVGFNVVNFDFPQDDTQGRVEATFLKRWADSNASFARLVHPVGFMNFTLEHAVPFVAFMQNTTNTSMYLTSFHQPTPAWPPEANFSTALAEFSKQQVDFVSSLVVDHNLTNIQYYCFSNEMENAYNHSAWLAYNDAIHAEQQARGGTVSAVHLVGSDHGCDDLEWVGTSSAVDVLCCHSYSDDGYRGTVDLLKPAVNVAHAVKKPLILGEFGGNAQTSGPCKGSCSWWNAPSRFIETGGQVLAAKIFAAVSEGAFSAAYWTFMDIPRVSA
jgi:hypothetical protein